MTTLPDPSIAGAQRPSILSRLREFFSALGSKEQTICDPVALSEEDQSRLGMANRDMRKPAAAKREASLQDLSKSPTPLAMQHHPLNLLTRGAMHR